MSFRNRLKNTEKPKSEEPKQSYSDVDESLFSEPEVNNKQIEVLEEEIDNLRSQLQEASSGGIAPVNGQWQYGNFILTKLGIQMPSEIVEEEASILMSALLKIESAVQFWLGDLALVWIPDTDNNQEIGEAYQNFAQKFGVENIRTLRKYAYVCRNMPLSLRSNDASFSHHEVIASLPSKQEKAHWLKACVDNNWSVAELRQQLKPKSEPASKNWFDKWQKQANNIAKQRSKSELLQMAEYYRKLAESK